MKITIKILLEFLITYLLVIIMEEFGNPNRADDVKNKLFELLSLIFWCLWW